MSTDKENQDEMASSDSSQSDSSFSESSSESRSNARRAYQIVRDAQKSIATNQDLKKEVSQLQKVVVEQQSYIEELHHGKHTLELEVADLKTFLRQTQDSCNVIQDKLRVVSERETEAVNSIAALKKMTEKYEECKRAFCEVAKKRENLIKKYAESLSLLRNEMKRREMLQAELRRANNKNALADLPRKSKRLSEDLEISDDDARRLEELITKDGDEVPEKRASSPPRKPKRRSQRLSQELEISDDDARKLEDLITKDGDEVPEKRASTPTGKPKRRSQRLSQELEISDDDARKLEDLITKDGDEVPEKRASTPTKKPKRRSQRLSQELEISDDDARKLEDLITKDGDEVPEKRASTPTGKPKRRSQRLSQELEISDDDARKLEDLITKDGDEVPEKRASTASRKPEHVRGHNAEELTDQAVKKPVSEEQSALKPRCTGRQEITEPLIGQGVKKLDSDEHPSSTIKGDIIDATAATTDESTTSLRRARNNKPSLVDLPRKSKRFSQGLEISDDDARKLEDLITKDVDEVPEKRASNTPRKLKRTRRHSAEEPTKQAVKKPASEEQSAPKPKLTGTQEITEPLIDQDVKKLGGDENPSSAIKGDIIDVLAATTDESTTSLRRARNNKPSLVDLPRKSKRLTQGLEISDDDARKLEDLITKDVDEVPEKRASTLPREPKHKSNRLSQEMEISEDDARKLEDLITKDGDEVPEKRASTPTGKPKRRSQRLSQELEISDDDARKLEDLITKDGDEVPEKRASTASRKPEHVRGHNAEELTDQAVKKPVSEEQSAPKLKLTGTQEITEPLIVQDVKKLGSDENPSSAIKGDIIDALATTTDESTTSLRRARNNKPSLVDLPRKSKRFSQGLEISDDDARKLEDLITKDVDEVSEKRASNTPRKLKRTRRHSAEEPTKQAVKKPASEEQSAPKPKRTRRQEIMERLIGQDVKKLGSDEHPSNTIKGDIIDALAAFIDESTTSAATLPKLVRDLVSIILRMNVGDLRAMLKRAVHQGDTDDVVLGVRESIAFEFVNHIQEMEGMADFSYLLYRELLVEFYRMVSPSVHQFCKIVRCLSFSFVYTVNCQQERSAELSPDLIKAMKSILTVHESSIAVPAICYALAILHENAADIFFDKSDSFHWNVVRLHVSSWPEYEKLLHQLASLYLGDGATDGLTKPQAGDLDEWTQTSFFALIIGGFRRDDVSRYLTLCTFGGDVEKTNAAKMVFGKCEDAVKELSEDQSNATLSRKIRSLLLISARLITICGSERSDPAKRIHTFLTVSVPKYAKKIIDCLEVVKQSPAVVEAMKSWLRAMQPFTQARLAQFY
ncbi:hypothetical protein QR680_016241 [Steinernema hermaphroditum]|uniref:Uncharacterized protein n=1 Tax=Steinernema hermaphroditum TaxID=289476 RepID=A0AA39HD19_9BILA|nr:hypothetical protein QR680_016241 [Steinernema hermaphroditum]